MSNTERLISSTQRIRTQGVQFFTQTYQAGGTFFDDTQQATRTFGEELSAATAKLARSTTRSATNLGKTCQKEARLWRELAIKTRDAYLAAFTSQTEQLGAQATALRETLAPTALQTRVLRTANEVLGNAQQAVEAQLAEAKPPAEAVATRSRAAQGPRTVGRAPIRNYDQLTAKDVVGRIQRLSVPQATALIDYEQKRKNRATVIRAAKQRVAAS